MVNLTGMALIPTVVMMRRGERVVVDIDKQAEYIKRGYSREGDMPSLTEKQVDETPANLLLANKDGEHVLTDDNADNADNADEG